MLGFLGSLCHGHALVHALALTLTVPSPSGSCVVAVEYLEAPFHYGPGGDVGLFCFDISLKLKKKNSIITKTLLFGEDIALGQRTLKTKIPLISKFLDARVKQSNKKSNL